MSKETALKIACGFGGGCRSGEICGAASGAVLVVGLKCGHFIVDNIESKKNCYAKTVEFLNTFRTKNRSVVCREILGYDISTDEGYKQAQSRDLFKTICFDMVKSAVSILEESGY
jgi:C_GCAxxG_C_C family probable redox protein